MKFQCMKYVRLIKLMLSFHTYETILPQTKFNHYAELITSLGPRSRRVRIFQTFRFLLLFNFFSFRDVFSIEKKPGISSRMFGFFMLEFRAEYWAFNSLPACCSVSLENYTPCFLVLDATLVAIFRCTSPDTLWSLFHRLKRRR